MNRKVSCCISLLRGHRFITYATFCIVYSYPLIHPHSTLLYHRTVCKPLTHNPREEHMGAKANAADQGCGSDAFGELRRPSLYQGANVQNVRYNHGQWTIIEGELS